MELKDRIKNYYKSEKIKVDDEFIRGVIADKNRANKLIKFLELIEIKAMNYIYGKDERKELSVEECPWWNGYQGKNRGGQFTS